jgi:O-acetyl-ADP-ribose deacetylase (regulator of RNase III)
MGRGIALQFKKAFPDNFRDYAAACRRGEVRPGTPHVHDRGEGSTPRYVINLPTKRHWRDLSRLEDVQAGLRALATELGRRGIASVALPPLGCGLGGLSWGSVRPLVEAALGPLAGVRVIVYEPAGAAATPPVSAPGPAMTPGRAALLLLMDRYLAGLLDPIVTLLEVHKLTYFLQAAGQPLRLQFTRGHYGPYAENLRHVLHIVEGHFLRGYGDGGDASGRQLEILPGVLDEACRAVGGDPELQVRIARVADLVDGFESPAGLELLATVHWVSEHENPGGPESLVRAVHAWGPRKQAFTPRQIQLASGVLAAKGWLPVSHAAG